MTRFYGMHRVNMKPYKGTHFVIMANVFYTRNDIHIMYDLKGSSVGREATEEEIKRYEAGLKVVMKDNDLQHPGRGHKLHVGPEYKAKMLQQLKKDCSFLAKLQIMDYSLLLGIHQKNKRGRSATTVTTSKKDNTASLDVVPSVIPSSITPKEEEKKKEEGVEGKGLESISPEIDAGIPSVGVAEEEIYYIGIIDILQLYNTRKVAENFFKGFTHDRHEISAVNPVEYATRFLSFINHNSK